MIKNECNFSTWYLDYIDDGCDAVRNAAHAAWQHQAARIAPLETKTAQMEDLVDIANKSLRRISELEAQVQQLQRVPLSDGEIKNIIAGLEHSPWLNPHGFARAIEAAHNIK